MVVAKKSEGKNIYMCQECGFWYKEKDMAKKCEKWCKETNSCNLEIIKNALPR